MDLRIRSHFNSRHIPNLLIGVVAALILGLGVITVAGLSRSHGRLSAGFDRAEQFARALDTARAAQLHFNKQVQEWKNVLLRGHDRADFDKYLARFTAEEAEARARLFALRGLEPEAAATIDRLQAEHQQLGRRYRQALGHYNGGDPDSIRDVDSMVRGMDPPFTDGVSALVDTIEAERAANATQIQDQARFERNRIEIGSLAGLVVAMLLIATLAVLTRNLERSRGRDAVDRVKTDLDRVFQASPDGLAMLRDGRWVYTNPALARTLGYSSPADLVGRLITEFVPDEEKQSTGQRVAAFERSGIPPPPAERNFVAQDGSPRTIEVVPGPAIEFDGAKAMVVALRDVTVRKKMESRLLAADRLASVGTLAAGVAHEINNPLAYIIANMQFVEEALAKLARGETLTGAQPDILAALAEARQGTDRVRQIVRDLKVFSRAEDETRTVVDIHRMLDSALNMSANQIRHRARVEKRLGPTPMVEANEGRLGQVFINLLVNAAQAIPEGAADRNEIRVTTSTDAEGRAVIEVSDTGSGISAKNLTRIFDPFFTTKAIGEGTGLGLAISHGIVTSFGGEIVAESTPGNGATFRVTLPPAPATTAVAEKSVAAAPRGPRGRVLVIDDEPGICNAIRRLLTVEHEVVTATSGKDALGQIEGATFDVVLCDLMMPVMTGIELYDRIKQTAPEVLPRMIFLTGGAFTPSALEFLATVPNQRIDKPFNGAALRKVVRSAVEQQRDSGQPRSEPAL